MRQIDGRAHDQRIPVAAGQLQHEHLVDLQLTRRQLLEIGQRGQPRAIIVDRDGDADIGEDLEIGDRALRVANHRGFGDLEADLGPALDDLGAGLLHEAGIAEQLARNIDEHGQMVAVRGE